MLLHKRCETFWDHKNDEIRLRKYSACKTKIKVGTYREILIQHNAKGTDHNHMNLVDKELEDAFHPFYLYQNFWEVCVFPNAPSSNMTLSLTLQLNGIHLK